MSVKDFISAIQTNFCIEKLTSEYDAKPSKPLEYGLYLENNWYKLNLKQEKLYNPLIEWAEKCLSIKLNKAPGLLFVEQPILNSIKIKNYVEDLDNFQLTALHELTKCLGSLFTALALYNKFVSPDQAWEIANVEDNFRIEIWGEVEEEMVIKNINLEFFNNIGKILNMI